MSWIDRLKAACIVCISTIISFLIVEYSYRYITDAGINDDFKNRTMLFEAGDNFKNHDGYFKYFPNKVIRSTTLYSKSEPESIEDLVIEYDYLIRTNNVGLVMQEDVFPNERVIFVIGDSFTEGQGASPWFYDLENSYNNANAKIVNLGILGTGPQQWENLASSISKELRLDVSATVINILPGDMTRNVWMFHERVLNCLYRASCDYATGFQAVRFLGYKFKVQESYDDIKRSVLSDLVKSETITNSDSNLRKIKDLIKKSRVILDLYHYFILDLYPYFKQGSKQGSQLQIVQLNEASLLALNKAVSGNFYVNVVSYKEKLNSNNFADNETALRLIEFLQRNEIKYKWCDIPADGYHKYDGHPNANGYKILRKCTRDALEKLDFVFQ